MQIAAPYTNDSRWRDIPDEYNIEYTETSTLEKITDFCELYKNKRINIFFKDVDIDFSVLKIINKAFPHIYIRLDHTQLHYIAKLKEENIKFFFDKDLPCYSFGLLDFMLSIGTSDIYPYDTLWYNMDAVKQKCQENNINIRLVLNEIPTLQPNAGEDYRSPIFTPRDVSMLEEYVDTVEFNCYDKDLYYNWTIFDVHYDTWIKNREWIGSLRELIPNVKINIPVYSIPARWCERRMNCGRRCSLGYSCKHCLQYIETAQLLWERGSYIKNSGKNIEGEAY